MVSALRKHPSNPVPVAPELPAPVMDILTDVRRAGLVCRTAARADVFRTCALLASDNRVTRTGFAKALVQCLTQVLAKKPVLFRPGVSELSFDERWLGSALCAARRGDAASFAFLMRRRVQAKDRRCIGFLIQALAREM